MYKLIFSSSGSADEVIMNVVLKSPLAYFKTQVFTSDRELAEQSSILASMLSDYFNISDAENFEISFGPKNKESPACCVNFSRTRRGKIFVTAELRQIAFGNEHSAVDSCVIHFATDPATLNVFVEQVLALIAKTRTKAQLYGFGRSNF